MADVPFTVMVEEARRGELEEIARALEKRGLRVTQQLPRFRTITGQGDASIEAELKGVAGVENVRPDRGFQLPPMDEDVPQ
jgi:hypothetical protein